MSFRYLDEIVAEVAPLAVRFEEAGHRLYLVGGIVRDLWLDRPLDDHSDIDLTTDALPGQTRTLLASLADAVWTQGERFGTIGIHFAGRAIEITTHRAESYSPESRKPQVSFGSDITVDLSRRDFTVNAMAVALPSADLVDPWSGADDLAAGFLRTPLEPDVSFTDDPLRMLRAARFAAKYRLEPGVELIDAASRLRERLRIVAIERIGDELRRLFGLDDPSPGVDLLVQTGLAEILLTWHADDDRVIDRRRIEDAVDAVRPASVGGSADWHTRFAAFLLVALGDADEVADACRRLRLSKDDRGRIVDLARAAAAVLAVDDVDPPSLRRWVSTAGDPHRAIDVARATATARSASDAVQRVDRFSSAHEALSEAETPNDLVVLDGATIMRELGVEPGPVVGEAVGVLRDVLFEHGPLDDAEQLAHLRRWWSQRSGGR